MSFFHTIWGPLGSFLCILYGAPQICFFSYNMRAPLRSVSLFTIWGPPQISLFACCRGATSHLGFFHKIYGAPSDQFLRLLYRVPSDQFLCILFGGPSQISFFSYYMGPPQISFFAYYMGGGGPLISFFVYYMGVPEISFFVYYMRAPPSDQFLRLLYGGPIRSISLHTI